MRSTTMTGVLLTAVLLLGGCGTDSDTNATPEPADSVAAVEPSATDAMEPADSMAPMESDDASMAPMEGEESMDPMESHDSDSMAPMEETDGEPVADTLNFTGETIDGQSFDGAQLAGTPTVLWFWAPWCPTCRAQVDGVEAVAAKYDGKVKVVGVGGLSDSEAIIDFAEGVAGPTHLVDEEGSVWRHFGITGQSTYVMLDADGNVVKDGYLDNDALETAVAELAG